MNEHDESDSLIVPRKQANKTAKAAAEPVEGRGLAKGNSRELNASRTQRRNDAPSALERIREVTPSRHDPRQEPGALCGELNYVVKTQPGR
jgi:RNA-directed DNA polymerase